MTRSVETESDLDRRLAGLRAVASPPEGLEARVLAGVLRHVRAERLAAKPSRWAMGSWAPVAAAGCALCVLAGGLAVERETLRVPPSADSAAVLQARPPVQAAVSGLATASAERVPAARIAVGQRRGRNGAQAGRVHRAE